MHFPSHRLWVTVYFLDHIPLPRGLNPGPICLQIVPENYSCCWPFVKDGGTTIAFLLKERRASAYFPDRTQTKEAF